jgi:sugar transferase EpsL
MISVTARTCWGWKRVMDVVASGLGLVAAAPVVAVSAVAIRATMGSPVFFRQERPGLAGRPFELLKLRTMRGLRVGEVEAKSEAARLTSLGRFLRATSADELPTLWNVLKGDMSLVGPRPLLMPYLARYSPRQAKRHAVKPGITGWAQIHGRNALTWDEKLELDVWYVEHQSLWLDLRILARTVWKVIRREGISHAGEATMSEFLGPSGP